MTGLVLLAGAALAVEPIAFPSLPGPEAHLGCPLALATVGLTGDTMVHGMQLSAALQDDGTYSMDGLFDEVAPLLAAPDLMCTNLETNIAGEDLGGYTGYPRFNSPPTLLEELRQSGVDLLQTTNNHCLDRGETGNERTIAAVDDHGFLQTGTYVDLEDRRTPWTMTTLPNGVRVAVLAYTYGTEAPPPPERWWRVAYLDQYRFPADIAAARQAGADLVIVGLHWGLEYRHQPEPWQVDLAHHIVDLGADVVWGTHPHVLQPAEVLTRDDGPGGPRDALVLYSLGNFVSNQRTPNRDGGVIVHVDVLRCDRHDRTWLADARFHPVWVDDRAASRALRFRVLPMVPGPAWCGDADLSEEDCAARERFHAHAAEILPEGSLGREREASWYAVAAAPRWYGYFAGAAVAEP